jgi:predicted Zn-dependent protease
MGTLSYFLVFMRDYQGALDAANSALAASPDLDWLKINKAHALMFLRRTDEARQIYLGQKGANPDDKWRQSIRTDFAELRSAGLEAPLMHDIEAE